VVKFIASNLAQLKAFHEQFVKDFETNRLSISDAVNRITETNIQNSFALYIANLRFAVDLVNQHKETLEANKVDVASLLEMLESPWKHFKKYSSIITRISENYRSNSKLAASLSVFLKCLKEYENRNSDDNSVSNAWDVLHRFSSGGGADAPKALLELLSANPLPRFICNCVCTQLRLAPKPKKDIVLFLFDQFLLVATVKQQQLPAVNLKEILYVSDLDACDIPDRSAADECNLLEVKRRAKAGTYCFSFDLKTQKEIWTSRLPGTRKLLRVALEF